MSRTGFEVGIGNGTHTATRASAPGITGTPKQQPIPWPPDVPCCILGATKRRQVVEIFRASKSLERDATWSDRPTSTKTKLKPVGSHASSTLKFPSTGASIGCRKRSASPHACWSGAGAPGAPPWAVLIRSPVAIVLDRHVGVFPSTGWPANDGGLAGHDHARNRGSIVCECGTMELHHNDSAGILSIGVRWSLPQEP